VFGDPDLENHAKEEFIYGKGYYMEHTDLWLTSVYSIGFGHTGVEKVFPTAEILGAPALVDSGSSLIVLMPDVWDALIVELGKHLVDCRIEDTDGSVAMCNCPEEFDKIPSLVINLIDENNLERPLCMAASEYILKSVDPTTGNSMCVPAIQRGNRKQPVPLIFGMTFMRAFYTNFDLANRRIGFARSSLSDLPAHADCSVHNKKEKELWLATTAFVAIAVAFAFYLCCCGDIGACCGWPSLSCEATQPCYGYSNLDPDQEQSVVAVLKKQDTTLSLESSNGHGQPSSIEMGAPTSLEKGVSQPVSETTLRVETQSGVADSRPPPAKEAGGDTPQDISGRSPPIAGIPKPEEQAIPTSARTV